MCNPIYHLSTFPMQCTVHWRRRWHPTPVLLLENPMDREPGGLQPMGSRSVGHNRATSLSFSLSCIGEGNGNPLQCSCLENPRDGGPWWAAVYGVTQSRTRLKWLSSGSSSSIQSIEFSRPEYWSGWPFPSPGDLPNLGIKPRSPTLQADSLPTEPPEKPKNTGMGSLSLLQEVFPTQDSNCSLLHCRQILYQLSYQG